MRKLGDEQWSTGGETHYRVSFETRNIGPTGLPPFAYIATGLTHNTVQYLALVPEGKADEEPTAYADLVRSHWPDAVIIYCEEGGHGIEAKEVHFSSGLMGRFKRKYSPPSLWARMADRVFGPDPDKRKLIGAE